MTNRGNLCVSIILDYYKKLCVLDNVLKDLETSMYFSKKYNFIQHLTTLVGQLVEIYKIHFEDSVDIMLTETLMWKSK